MHVAGTRNELSADSSVTGCFLTWMSLAWSQGIATAQVWACAGLLFHGSLTPPAQDRSNTLAVVCQNCRVIGSFLGLLPHGDVWLISPKGILPEVRGWVRRNVMDIPQRELKPLCYAGPAGWTAPHPLHCP